MIELQSVGAKFQFHTKVINNMESLRTWTLDIHRCYNSKGEWGWTIMNYMDPHLLPTKIDVISIFASLNEAYDDGIHFLMEYIQNYYQWNYGEREIEQCKNSKLK